MPDRLDRIEAILEKIAEQIKQTQIQIKTNARAIEANNNAITRWETEGREVQETLHEKVKRVAGVVETLVGEMHTMQSEISAMQATNNRVLERLEAFFSDSNGEN